MTLVVTDGNGCFDSAEALVGIDAVDGPAANANGPYPGVAICGSIAPNVTLDGSGSTAGGTAIVSYEWYEGTTLLGSGVSLSYYFAPGSYTVTLTVTDGNGCTDSDTASVEIGELTGLTDVTFSGGPFTLCVDWDKDIGLDITIIPEFCDIPGDEITLADCLASGGTINNYSGGCFSISGTTLTGISKGVGYITITYKDQTGLCGIGDVESDPIDVVVEADRFFLKDNHNNFYTVDINEPSSITEPIEILHKSQHVFFGVSACNDPGAIIDYKTDRKHCGGSVTDWRQVLGGVIDPEDVLLCNGEITELTIRITGSSPGEYVFYLFRPKTP